MHMSSAQCMCTQLAGADVDSEPSRMAAMAHRPTAVAGICMRQLPLSNICRGTSDGQHVFSGPRCPTIERSLTDRRALISSPPPGRAGCSAAPAASWSPAAAVLVHLPTGSVSVLWERAAGAGEAGGATGAPAPLALLRRRFMAPCRPAGCALQPLLCDAQDQRGRPKYASVSHERPTRHELQALAATA